MLWLGRGKLALAYFFVTIILYGLVIVAEEFGFVSSAPLAIYPAHSIASFPVFVLLLLLGIIHGLKIREASTSRPWFRWIAIVPAWVLAIALIVFWPIWEFLFQPFSIPAASGIPNLMIGDHVLVSKYAYSPGRPPQRGDLAVFKLPGNTDVDYIKRVVGLPGDHIRMIEGVLNINGVPVALEEAKLAPEFYRASEFYRGELTFFRETLPGGRSYMVANSENNGFADNTQEYVLPPGHYFVLGDNRDNSQDSRFIDAVGYVPEQNFVGPVALRFWNSEDFSLANRPEEISPVN